MVLMEASTRMLITLLLPLLASCAVTRNPVGAMDPDARQHCIRQGGTPTYVLIGKEACVIATSDAGRPCSDGGECQGRCDAPFRAAKGSDVVGACSAQIGQGGCIDIVVNGKASGEWCFD